MYERTFYMISDVDMLGTLFPPPTLNTNYLLVLQTVFLVNCKYMIHIWWKYESWWLHCFVLFTRHCSIFVTFWNNQARNHTSNTTGKWWWTNGICFCFRIFFGNLWIFIVDISGYAHPEPPHRPRFSMGILKMMRGKKSQRIQMYDWYDCLGRFRVFGCI